MTLSENVAFYTVNEIADHLRISAMTVYRAINSGELRLLLERATADVTE